MSREPAPRVSDERIRHAVASFAHRRNLAAQASGGIPIFYPEEQLWLDLRDARARIARLEAALAAAAADQRFCSGEHAVAWLNMADGECAECNARARGAAKVEAALAAQEPAVRLAEVTNNYVAGGPGVPVDTDMLVAEVQRYRDATQESP